MKLFSDTFLQLVIYTGINKATCQIENFYSPFISVQFCTEPRNHHPSQEARSQRTCTLFYKLHLFLIITFTMMFHQKYIDDSLATRLRKVHGEKFHNTWLNMLPQLTDKQSDGTGSLSRWANYACQIN